MGMIFNIQRFSLHDGPGIRTTVFLKGCPLNCVWCHNPESKEAKPQLSFTVQRCVSCGRCINACPNGVHTIENGRRVVQWELCKSSGECASVCPTDALEMIGKEVDADEIVKEVAKDIPFYDISGGGITISGGEPMMQPEFTLEILRKAKKKGINTTLDTCGNFDWAKFKTVLPFLDLVLFDLKQMDSRVHKEVTGKDNTVILDNLSKTVCEAIPTIIRVPIIPGYTDTEKNLHEMGKFLNRFSHCPDVELLPYNMLAGSKHSRFGLEYKLRTISELDPQNLQNLVEILSSCGTRATSLNYVDW